MLDVVVSSLDLRLHTVATQNARNLIILRRTHYILDLNSGVIDWQLRLSRIMHLAYRLGSGDLRHLQTHGGLSTRFISWWHNSDCLSAETASFFFLCQLLLHY